MCFLKLTFPVNLKIAVMAKTRHNRYFFVNPQGQTVSNALYIAFGACTPNKSSEASRTVLTLFTNERRAFF